MLSTSFQQYGDFVKKNKLSTNRSGADASAPWGPGSKERSSSTWRRTVCADRLKGYAWEFNLVESKEVNAWCMPGGKVVVYTGILPVTRDEQGLAVVLGHEIAHAIAEHGNERMSQEMIAQFGGSALSELLKSKPARNPAALDGGVRRRARSTASFFPYSRTHESEADHLGLIFMAMAGYDPNGALDFWQRMAATKQGKAPPEFMSTHPSDETRIAQIRQNLPEAMKYYTPAR